MKKTNYLFMLAAFFMLFTPNNADAQTIGHWTSSGSFTNVLRNNFTTPSFGTVDEVQLATSFNTRLRLHDNGQWQINPRSGAGGFISYPSGQANFATFRIQGGGTSGLVSYSFQNSNWGQNIQSYVGRAYTVSYAVKWNGSDRFYVAGQGWLYANGAWFGSDRELKTEIKPIEKPLAKVLKLQGYTYRFKDEQRCADCDQATDPAIDGKIEMGLIADEVEQIVPEVVRQIDTDNRRAIAYQNLVALLIESTKEQQKLIDNLEAQVAKMMAFGGFNGNGHGNGGGNGNGNGNNGNGNGNGGSNNAMDLCKLIDNSPNPFNTSTDIDYYLNATAGTAEIKVWDMAGVEATRMNLTATQGNGTVTLDAADLNGPGTYVYGLIVDGAVVDAKTAICN